MLTKYTDCKVTEKLLSVLSALSWKLYASHWSEDMGESLQ